MNPEGMPKVREDVEELSLKVHEGSIPPEKYESARKLIVLYEAFVQSKIEDEAKSIANLDEMEREAQAKFPEPEMDFLRDSLSRSRKMVRDQAFVRS